MVDYRGNKMDQEIDVLKRQSAARRLERRRQILEYRERSIRRKRRIRKGITAVFLLIVLARIGLPIRKHAVAKLTVGEEEKYTSSLLSGEAYSRYGNSHMKLISGRIVISDETDEKCFEDEAF